MERKNESLGFSLNQTTLDFVINMCTQCCTQHGFLSTKAGWVKIPIKAYGLYKSTPSLFDVDTADMCNHWPLFTAAQNLGLVLNLFISMHFPAPVLKVGLLIEGCDDRHYSTRNLSVQHLCRHQTPTCKLCSLVATPQGPKPQGLWNW